MARTATLSGWGQPHDALAVIAPEAAHIDYARHKNIRDALEDIATQARNSDVVIGWSLGGQLAALAVAEGIMKPKQLVLIAASYQFVSTKKNPLGMTRDLYDKFRSNVARNPERALRKAWELVASGDSRADQVREYMNRQDIKKTLEYDWLHWLDMLTEFNFYDMNFTNFPPTLLLHGDKDVVASPEQSQRFSTAIPYSRIIIYSGAGHAPHWHDSNAVENAIKEHNKSCEPQGCTGSKDVITDPAQSLRASQDV